MTSFLNLSTELLSVFGVVDADLSAGVRGEPVSQCHLRGDLSATSA